MVDIDIEELSFGGSGSSKHKARLHANHHNTYYLARERVADLRGPSSAERARRCWLLGACCGFCPGHFAASEDRRVTRLQLKHAFETIDDDNSGELDMGELDLWFQMAKTKPALTALQIADAKRTIDGDGGGTVDFSELWIWWRSQDPPLKLCAIEDYDSSEESEESSGDDTEIHGAPSQLSNLTGGAFGEGRHRAAAVAKLKAAEDTVHESEGLSRLTGGRFGHGEHRKKMLRGIERLLGSEAHKSADSTAAEIKKPPTTEEKHAIVLAKTAVLEAGRLAAERDIALEEVAEDNAPLPSLSQAMRHQIELLPDWESGAPDGSGSNFSRDAKIWCCTCFADACGDASAPCCAKFCCDPHACFLWQAFFEPLRTIGENITVEMGVYFSNLGYVLLALCCCTAACAVRCVMNWQMNAAVLVDDTYPIYYCKNPLNPDELLSLTLPTAQNMGGMDRSVACCGTINSTGVFNCATNRDLPADTFTVLAVTDIIDRTSSFAMMYLYRLNSLNAPTVAEASEVTLSADAVESMVWTSQVMCGIVVLVFIATTRRLFSRTSEADNFLDAAMTTPGDYALEVRRLPPTARARDVAEIFSQRGWLVDKVVMHYPFAPMPDLGDKATDMLLELIAARAELAQLKRMSLQVDARLRSPTKGDRKTSNLDTSVAPPAAPPSAAAALDTANGSVAVEEDGAIPIDEEDAKENADAGAIADAEEHLDFLEVKCAHALGEALEGAVVAYTDYFGSFAHSEEGTAGQLLGGVACCRVRSRFATAFVSFRYEAERAEAERAYGTWAAFAPIMTCDTRAARLDMDNVVDLPFCCGMGYGCGSCTKRTTHFSNKRCGFHRASRHWDGMDSHMRRAEDKGGLNWGDQWHMGWLAWWLFGGCCGVKWSHNLTVSTSPLDNSIVVDLSEYDATPEPTTSGDAVLSDGGAVNTASGDSGKAGESEENGKETSVVLSAANGAKIEARLEKMKALLEKAEHLHKAERLRGFALVRHSIKTRLGFGERHSVALMAIRNAAGCTISVKRAPEPADVVWENLHTASVTRFIATLFTIAVLCLFAALVSSSSYLYIWWKQEQFRRPDEEIFQQYGQLLLYCITYGNLILKLLATKVLIPMMKKSCAKSRTEAQADVFLLLSTFGIESMQTVLFSFATLYLAHTSASPHLGGTKAGDQSGGTTPVDPTATANAFVLTKALSEYYRTTLINTMVILAIMDSPFMLPVWLGRFFGVLLPKAFDLLWDCVAVSRPASETTGKTPEQYLVEEIAIADNEEKKAELQGKLAALRHEASVSTQLLTDGEGGDSSPGTMHGYTDQTGTDGGSLAFIDSNLKASLDEAEVDLECDVASLAGAEQGRTHRDAQVSSHRAVLRQRLSDAQARETAVLAEAAAALEEDLEDQASESSQTTDLEASQTMENESVSLAAVPDAMALDAEALLQKVHSTRQASLAFTTAMRASGTEAAMEDHSRMGRIIHRAAVHLTEEVEDAVNEALLVYEIEDHEPMGGTNGISIDQRAGHSVNNPHNYHERKTLTGEVWERRHFVVADAFANQVSAKGKRKEQRRTKMVGQLREAHQAVLRAKANAELAGEKKHLVSEEEALLLWRRVYLPVLMDLTSHQIEVLFERRYGVAIFPRRPILLAARFRRLRAKRERVHLAMKFGHSLKGEGIEVHPVQQDIAAEIAEHTAEVGEGLETDPPIPTSPRNYLHINTDARPSVTPHEEEPGLLTPTSAERKRIVLAADGHTHINETLALKYLLTRSGAGIFPTLREEMLVCFLEEFLKDSTTWTWRDEAPIWRKIEKRDRLVQLGLEEPDDEEEDEAAAKTDAKTLASADECEATVKNAVELGISTLGMDLYGKSSLPAELTAKKWQVMEAKQKQEARVEKLRAKALHVADLEHKKSHPAEHKAQVEKEAANAKEARRKSKLLRNGDKPPFHPCGLINAVQTDVSKKWQAPVVPYHIWASKAANAVLIVCILAPYSPILIFYALGLIVSMYIFEIFSLVRLHAKPPKRGVEGAGIFVTMLLGCSIAAVVSSAYQTYLFFGGGSPLSVSTDPNEANPSLTEGRFAASVVRTLIFLAVVCVASYLFSVVEIAYWQTFTFCRRLDMCTCGSATGATIAAREKLRVLQAENNDAFDVAAAGVVEESARTKD